LKPNKAQLVGAGGNMTAPKGPAWSDHPRAVRAWVCFVVLLAVVYAVARKDSGPVLLVTPLVLAVTICVSGAVISFVVGHDLGDRGGTQFHGVSADGVFFVAAALLLPASLIVGMCVSVVAIERWLMRGVWSWHQPLYNACVAVMMTLSVQHVVGLAVGPDVLTAAWIGLVMAALSATVAVVALDVVFGYTVLRLAHRLSLRRSGLVRASNIISLATQTVLGLMLAAFWSIAPVLVLLLVPLVVSAHHGIALPSAQRAGRNDSKTGLYNAGHFLETARREVHRCQRNQTTASIMLLDIDHLGRLNNTLGHLAGDEAIIAVAEALRSSVREYDIASRFGGEEFAVLLPDTRGREAVAVAERVRCALASTGLQGPGIHSEVHVTVSIGVPERRNDEALEQLLKRVDDALYESKSAGRDRVTLVSAGTSAHA